MKHNTGEGIALIGSIWLFSIIQGWARWLVLIPIFLAFFTWTTHVNDKMVEELRKLSLHKIKLEAGLLAAKTSLAMTQREAILVNLKRR